MTIREGSFFHRLVTSNETFLAEERGLRYFGGAEAVVLIGSPQKMFKVCHIMFSGAGGIFVQAPYFQDSEGLVGLLTWKSSGKDGRTASFEPGFTKATSHLVKLHHPPDGNAHFSQTGKVNTEIWHKTFTLTDGTGYVFQLNLYGIEGHEYIAPDAPLPPNRIHLPFVFDGEVPDSITVFGEWLTKDDLRAKEGQSTEGPLVAYEESPGVMARAFLLAPPQPAPITHSLLRVTCGRAPSIARDETPLLVLRGAWSENGVNEECLAFLYPVADLAKSVARLGSIDRSAPKLER